MTDGATTHGKDRRRRETALLLPLLGVFLLMPPFIHLFTPERMVFGIPLIVVYIFSVWAGLIVLARLLAKKLSAAPAGTAEEAPKN